MKNILRLNHSNCNFSVVCVMLGFFLFDLILVLVFVMVLSWGLGRFLPRDPSIALRGEWALIQGAPPFYIFGFLTAAPLEFCKQNRPQIAEYS